MGWWAHAEGSNGDKLNVLLPNGLTGGKAILAFYMSLLDYCGDISDGGDGTCDGLFNDLKWFNKLSIDTKSLCEIATVLEKCIYSSEWDYLEGDFEHYVRCTGNTSTSEEEFISAAQQALNAWTETGLVREKVALLVEALKTPNLEDTFFFHAPYTLDDFVGLLEAIEILHKRNVERIRINIF